MTHNVLVIGHADADGHLIAEQTRRNLSLIDTFRVSTVVDPERTKDHKSWNNIGMLTEIDNADFVFFVDLMFGPQNLAQEAESLVQFVSERPEKRFFLIDHHPLPFRRLEAAENLRIAYRPDVFECTLGPRSGMMVAAALCENQKSLVSDIVTSHHEGIALGMKRAAALGGPLTGQKLMVLLRENIWKALKEIGEESKSLHRLPRGRRPAGDPLPESIRNLDNRATELLSTERHDTDDSTDNLRDNMAYDLEISEERFDQNAGVRARLQNRPAPSKDLEAIVSLLEVAALSLTKTPESTFTFDQLVEEARDLAGPNFDLDVRDAKIVMDKAYFVQKVIGQEYRLR